MKMVSRMVAVHVQRSLEDVQHRPQKNHPWENSSRLMAVLTVSFLVLAARQAEKKKKEGDEQF